MDDDTGEDAPPVFPPQAEKGGLAETLLDWLALPTGREQRRFLAAHPEVLQPRCLALLDGWISTETGQEEAQRLREGRSPLQDVRERGGTVEAICEAYVNMHGGFVLDLPAWLEEVESRLGALRSLGQPHETAQASVELLREALDRASGESDMAPETLAALQYELALAWQEHPPTDLSQAHETAIALCASAARSLSRDRYPRQHAEILNALGRAYSTRVVGERRDNLERAISCHRQALQVFSLQAFPQAYARTQTLLGQVYWQRVEGERRDNVEQALLCCREALGVRTLAGSPIDYAHRSSPGLNRSPGDFFLVFPFSQLKPVIGSYPCRKDLTREGCPKLVSRSLEDGISAPVHTLWPLEKLSGNLSKGTKKLRCDRVKADISAINLERRRFHE